MEEKQMHGQIERLTEQEREVYQNALKLIIENKDEDGAKIRLQGRVNRLERFLDMEAPQSVLQQEVYLVAKGMLECEGGYSPGLGKLISKIEVRKANEMEAVEEYHQFLTEMGNKHLE